jgi:hypothetical protein
MLTVPSAVTVTVSDPIDLSKRVDGALEIKS